MAPKRILAELIRRPTKHGEMFVGHVEHGRLTLHYAETRLGADGAPVEVWALSLEVTQYHPSHETAPRPGRRIGAQRDGARPVSGGP